MASFHTLEMEHHASFNRAHALLYLLAILLLMYRHLTSHTKLSLVLMIADAVFAFMWLTAQAFRWRPVRRRELLGKLRDAVGEREWPAMDVFICTADPYKEPPMSVANTALSVMGFDYPTEKLSVYVSDDGGSAMTLFAFMEAAEFARWWLPFCRRRGTVDRSPEVYFKLNIGDDGHGDYHKLKRMFLNMNERIESVMKRGYVEDHLITSKEKHEIFKKWKSFTRRDHPSIIQVLLDSTKDEDVSGRALPNLVYVSREKSPSVSHNFKAGALNALVRVSGAMSGAPVILTLDCDMYSNDPEAPIRTLCYFFDPNLAPKLGFVQFPQRYEGINKNDIYGNEIKRLFSIHPRGLDGLAGPNYVGSNCFFTRRSLVSEHVSGPETEDNGADNGNIQQLQNGKCERNGVGISLEMVLERAHKVAGCRFEKGTKWGSKIGFRYGSLVEDFHTGYRLHSEGWQSVFCDPERPAFLGDAPKSLNDVLNQCKRWIVGLFETTFSTYSPLFYVTRKASLLTGLCYTYYASWGFWSIPGIVYAILPQLGLFYGFSLFPNISDPWFYLYAYLFLAAYAQDLMEFIKGGGSLMQWWSDQRIWMFRCITSFLFGFIEFVLNHLGISTSGFNITSKVKEDELQELYERGVVEFGVASPLFISLGTAAIVSLCSLVVGIGRTLTKGFPSLDAQFVQLFISMFVAANCIPIYEAMFLRTDVGRMPKGATCISILLAFFLFSMGYCIF